MKRIYQAVDEAELFRKLKQDDSLAFEEIYHRYFLRLSNSAFKRLQDRTVTEEIVQELFVNLWLKRHQLPTLNTPERYLHTLLRNAVIDWFRGQVRQDDFAVEWLTQPDHQVVHNTEQHVLFTDLQQAYESTVRQLPDKCRQVYTLHQQGHSVADIAHQLGVSPKTVESHLHKAHYTLRHLLKDFSAISTALVAFFTNQPFG